jgi:hypothetical protein
MSLAGYMTRLKWKGNKHKALVGKIEGKTGKMVLKESSRNRIEGRSLIQLT